MPLRIFLAGAAGVVGRRLVPLLLAQGYDVTGTTRSAERAGLLAAAGIRPVVLDAFEAAPVMAAVAAAGPDVVIHQLTDLPQQIDPPVLAEALSRNARLRIEGTRNLVAAAVAAGVRRIVAQSIAFAYATGPRPHRETDPLDHGAQEPRAATVKGVAALEDAVTRTPGIDGLVLRYGRLYGPGTWNPAVASGAGSLHVDASAQAALLAVARGFPGIYNIAEDDGEVAIGKARRELGFDPDFRIPEQRP